MLTPVEQEALQAKVAASEPLTPAEQEEALKIQYADKLAELYAALFALDSEAFNSDPWGGNYRQFWHYEAFGGNAEAKAYSDWVQATFKMYQGEKAKILAGQPVDITGIPWPAKVNKPA